MQHKSSRGIWQRENIEGKVGIVCSVCLAINYTNTLCRQLQRDIINVSDQQKTDVILFIKRPTCSLYQCITVKLFASGTATCLFSFNKDFQAHDSLIFKQWNTKRRKLDPQWRKVTFTIILWYYRYDRKVGPSLLGKTWFTTSMCCLWSWHVSSGNKMNMCEREKAR